MESTRQITAGLADHGGDLKGYRPGSFHCRLKGARTAYETPADPCLNSNNDGNKGAQQESQQILETLPLQDRGCAATRCHTTVRKSTP